jgi:hypothetical protein
MTCARGYNIVMLADSTMRIDLVGISRDTEVERTTERSSWAPFRREAHDGLFKRMFRPDSRLGLSWNLKVKGASALS